jgi:hypothetical protein
MDIDSWFIAAQDFALGLCHSMDSIINITWTLNRTSLSVIQNHYTIQKKKQ